MTETFPGRSEKGAGAGFSRDQGSQYRPPRNAPAAEREVLEAVVLPAHPQTDEDDDDEVEQENADIDSEAEIHEMGYLATDEHG